MHLIYLKNIFHGSDSTSRVDEGMFIVLSLSILAPLALFVYAVFCLIMCLVQEMCIL